MIVKNITMKYKFISIFSLALFIAACGESTPDDESLVYISDTQFNFHQNTNQLYISTKVQPDLNGQALDKVIVEPRDLNKFNIVLISLTLGKFLISTG